MLGGHAGRLDTPKNMEVKRQWGARSKGYRGPTWQNAGEKYGNAAGALPIKFLDPNTEEVSSVQSTAPFDRSPMISYELDYFIPCSPVQAKWELVLISNFQYGFGKTAWAWDCIRPGSRTGWAAEGVRDRIQWRSCGE